MILYIRIWIVISSKLSKYTGYNYKIMIVDKDEKYTQKRC